jgi:hypothetical protein
MSNFEQVTALLPRLIAQPMPFHDARSTAGFRTPVQPKLGFVRAKYFANHSHSASFPRFYLLDQLFQWRRMKNPQPVVKYHSKMPPDSHLGAPQSGCGYGHRSEADDKPDGKPQPGIARQAKNQKKSAEAAPSGGPAFRPAWPVSNQPQASVISGSPLASENHFAAFARKSRRPR